MKQKPSLTISPSISIRELIRRGWEYRLKLLFGGPGLKTAPSPKIFHRKGIDVKHKPKSLEPQPEEQIEKIKKRCRKKEKCILTRNLHAGGFDLLARRLLKPKDYFTLLAIPNIRCFNKPQTKRCHRCIKDPQCSLRIEKLAVPRPAYVLATWKNHNRFLKADVRDRLRNLLCSPRYTVAQTRHFFKHYDRMRDRKERKETREKLKNDPPRPEISPLQQWVDEEIRKTARVIVQYVIDRPLPNLSFKQFLISSYLITHVNNTGAMMGTELTRDAVDPFPRTMVEICDKLAVWMNTVIAVLEMQSVDDTVYPPEIIDWNKVEEKGEEEGGKKSKPLKDFGEEYGGDDDDD